MLMEIPAIAPPDNPDDPEETSEDPEPDPEPPEPEPEPDTIPLSLDLLPPTPAVPADVPGIEFVPNELPPLLCEADSNPEDPGAEVGLPDADVLVEVDSGLSDACHAIWIMGA